MNIIGYQRKNGTYGIRNHLLILPTSVCASETAVRISQRIPGSIALPHQHGCCHVGKDYQQVLKTLIGFGKNPNVGAVLIIALGCEGIQPEEVKEEIAKTLKPVEQIIIQKSGGTVKAIEKGIQIAQRLMHILSQQQKTPFDLSQIILGLECGGSDPTSGMAANPAIGVASDLLIKQGGISVLSETTELIGAEHIIAKRAVNENITQKLLAMVQRTEQRAVEMGVDLRGSQPTPGNIKGGLTTIEEKSLGCIYKAGSAPIVDVLEYAQDIPHKTGLYFMDTPGQDIESITGMLAGGVQIIVFTTGRGTPTGSPIAPVIKITGNSLTYQQMTDNIDINTGEVINGKQTIEQAGQDIFSEIIRVSNGQQTKAEILGHKEFALFRIGYTF